MGNQELKKLFRFAPVPFVLGDFFLPAPDAPRPQRLDAQLIAGMGRHLVEAVSCKEASNIRRVHAALPRLQQHRHNHAGIAPTEQGRARDEVIIAMRLCQSQPFFKVRQRPLALPRAPVCEREPETRRRRSKAIAALAKGVKGLGENWQTLARVLCHDMRDTEREINERDNPRIPCCASNFQAIRRVAPRAHRETLLILALIYAMQGRADEAMAAAQDGIAVGQQLHSSFVSAVGQMRLGHAYLVGGDNDAAVHCYQEAVHLGDQLAVRRLRAEARWGMVRAHGFAGDLDAARRDAADGLEVGRAAGDAWIVALINLSLGVAHVVTQHERQSLPILTEALDAFRECGDSFGTTAARLWLALAHWRAGQRERALAHLEEGLTLAQTHGYDYLVTRPTLLGWRDPRVIVPVLLEARTRGVHTAFIGRLLAANGLDKVAMHPGYQLRVQTLGAWRVWRGEDEVTEHEWHRRKAKQLFQLLVTHRGRLLPREEILDLLWRDDTPEAAARDFKVALNALNKALEPERAADGNPAFIAREDQAYGLRPAADVRIDVDEFARLIARAETADPANVLDLYRQALALYGDDYLQADARYEEWATAERERLLDLYLRTADRLAQQLLARGDYD